MLASLQMQQYICTRKIKRNKEVNKMEKFNLWTATHKLQWENELDVEYEDVLRAIKMKAKV